MRNCRPTVRFSLPRFAAVRALPRFAAMLALGALLFHALLPLTQQAVRQVQAANGIEQVVLCSAMGLRTMAMKDGIPVDTDPAKSEKMSQTCPVCLGSAHLPAGILPTAPRLALPQMAATVLYGAAGSSTLAQASTYSPPARGPPASLS